MLRTFFFSLSCLFVCVHAPAAEAQAPNAFPGEIDPIDVPPDHDPLAHAWDRPDERGGFYLRAGMGLGFQGTHLGPAPWKDDRDGRRAHGFASGFNLDLGGMLAPWVALHLTTHAGVLWSGDLDRAFGVAGSGSTTRIAAYGAGPAATFFTPRNFYFTLGAGVGVARVRYTDYDHWTRPGFFLNAVAGKDLYADQHFSFGLQMQVVYMLLGAQHAYDEARVRQFLFGTSFGFDSI